MSSKDYWARREREALQHYVTDEAEYDKRINKIYSNMLANCQKEINAFYGRYADKEGITIAEAKKRVSSMDIKAYEAKAKKYVENKTFSKQANEEMRLYNATMRINRLEMLKANIGLELITGADDLEKFIGGILKGRTEAELARQAGILGKTIKNNAQLVHSIVNASFHNATFSDRIWNNSAAMKADLDKLIQSGLIAGKNANVLSKDLQKYFIGEPRLKNGKKGAKYRAEVLMRTELARVQTEAQKQSFIRNGFTQYQFIVNGGCCDICEEIKGKVFDVEKMMPGENAPPMHPLCRCSTAAYSDREEYEAWLDYLENGGTTAEWEDHGKAEWQKLTKNNNSSIISTPKESTDTNYNNLLKSLQRHSVEYKAVENHKKKLSESEIIAALAGGDMTQGSCASLGLAYIGQKLGWNILDFRDGISRKIFSGSYNLFTLSNMKGIKTLKAEGASAITVGNRLLKQCEVGKEYYLCVGRHAAIVRKTDEGKYQYLELQSAHNSGWNDFNGNPRYTLKTRFGCSQSSSASSLYDFMIDIDESDFTVEDNFRSLLGFINTEEGAQRKGTYGTIK